MSEGLEEVTQKLKAYIGGVDDAEEFTVDNRYIVSGYRINHNSCRSVCKSLFTCHNESVNVWSHIAGVSVFIGLLITLCVQVIPEQFWYAKRLDTEFAGVSSSMSPTLFIDTKIADLDLL